MYFGVQVFKGYEEAQNLEQSNAEEINNLVNGRLIEEALCLKKVAHFNKISNRQPEDPIAYERSRQSIREWKAEMDDQNNLETGESIQLTELLELGGQPSATLYEIATSQAWSWWEVLVTALWC
jgi:hypothetical protein